MKKTLLLMILDGFGWREEKEGNAIAQADTPCLDRLFASCPHTLLGASGLDVGLPQGQMGNSEVGHTNIDGWSTRSWPASPNLSRKESSSKIKSCSKRCRAANPRTSPCI